MIFSTKLFLYVEEKIIELQDDQIIQKKKKKKARAFQFKW